MLIEWNKVTWYSKLLAVILFVGTFFLGFYFGRIYGLSLSLVNTNLLNDTMNAPINYKDATYKIEGQNVTLLNGVAETEIAPGSASKLMTRYFGNEAYGDLNGDQIPDIAFLLTQDGGGSGTFYYVVAALKVGYGYEGTNAILLGDRIAPQTTEIKNGELIVNYAERRPGEPMSTQPSIGISKYLKVENGSLVEVK